jgi:hypothetical protein
MATGRRRWWIAVGGATAAVAIAMCAVVALGAPSGLTAASPTKVPVLSWSDDGVDGAADSYSVQRASGPCSPGTPMFSDLGPATTPFTDTPPPPDGTYCYQVVGHYPTPADVPAVTPKQVVVDNSGPNLPVFTPQTPPAGSSIHGIVTVGASSTDALSPMGHVTLSVTPGGILTTAAGGTASFAWNTTTVADGVYTLHADAADSLGNPSPTASLTVTVDNTAPAAFTVFAPSPVAGSPTLSWTTVAGLTYTVTRDGVAVGVVSSPWTDSGATPGMHTYVVTATDGAQNATHAPPVSVQVIAASATSPRNLSAASPTNAVPHLTWQKPTTFAVTSWQVSRDGGIVATINDPNVMTFDDAAVGGQGPHTYSVTAFSGGTPGDPSAPITVLYDTAAPTLAAPTGASDPTGAISISWADATDPSPGSGVSTYILRRGSPTSPPADPTAGTPICMIALPAATGCLDAATQSGTTYSYALFAIDGAGNVSRQSVNVKSLDTVAPDQVTGFHASVGPTNAHLFWTSPARTGNDSDLAGFRVIRLAAGQTQPTNPRDGTEVCPGLGFRDADCFVQNLTRGKKVTFAVYAIDEVPNFSPPTLLTVTPKGDSAPPHPPTKVRVKRVGARITMTWATPRDRDLSHFVLALNASGPLKGPNAGKRVFKGRKLSASFTLKAGQITYANLFAIDLSDNHSPRVYRLIIMPDTIAVPKSKHKVAAKKSATPPKKTAKP